MTNEVSVLYGETLLERMLAVVSDRVRDYEEFCENQYEAPAEEGCYPEGRGEDLRRVRDLFQKLVDTKESFWLHESSEEALELAKQYRFVTLKKMLEAMKDRANDYSENCIHLEGDTDYPTGMGDDLDEICEFLNGLLEIKPIEPAPYEEHEATSTYLKEHKEEIMKLWGMTEGNWRAFASQVGKGAWMQFHQEGTHDSFGKVDYLNRISQWIGGGEVESLFPQYPHVHYINMGDTYNTTVVLIWDTVYITNWGDVLQYLEDEDGRSED